MPPETTAKLEMDQNEFNDFLREVDQTGKPDTGAGDKKSPAGGELSDYLQKTDEIKPEPKVVVTDEQKPADHQVDNRDQQIEELRREIANLKTTRQVESRREAEIEFVDLPGGIKLPKNRENYPIKLNRELVSALGFDPDTTEPLEKLLNAFHLYTSAAHLRMTEERIRQIQQSTDSRSSAETMFFEKYPDLKQFRDLAEMVDQQATREGLNQRYQGDPTGYINEVGRRTRARLAQMRGISIEEYERGLGGNGQQRSSNNGSRAISTSGAAAGRGTTRPNRGEQSSIMEDTFIR